MKFSELEIHPDIIRATQDMGFDELTEIQEQCLDYGLEGRDITGISQTGTGKTVAFLMPILHGIFTDNLPGPAALIVTPTRELCLQITEEARKLCAHHPIGVTAVYGGEGYREQETELAKDPHLIVATPGRLIDYVKQGKVKAGNLRYLVLDEADRMFDMGFIRDIRYIMKFTPVEKQTMLFSATLAYYVLRLASDYLHDPVEVKVESESIAVEKIDQKLFHLGRKEKLPYLINQIFEAGEVRAIIFTNYKSTVPFLVNSLRRFGVAAVGLSSALDQRKRVRLLKDFKLGHYTALVATDVASRGLHVDDITHVFNYDLPQDAEGYVHRIGRTARAGKSGISISYCCEEDYENLPRIQRLMRNKIPQGQIEMKYLNMPEGEFEPFHDRVHAQRDHAASEREHEGGAEPGNERGREDGPRFGPHSGGPVAGHSQGDRDRAGGDGKRRRRRGRGRSDGGGPRPDRPSRPAHSTVHSAAHPDEEGILPNSNRAPKPVDVDGNKIDDAASVRAQDRAALLGRLHGGPRRPDAERGNTGSDNRGNQRHRGQAHGQKSHHDSRNRPRRHQQGDRSAAETGSARGANRGRVDAQGNPIEHVGQHPRQRDGQGQGRGRRRRRGGGGSGRDSRDTRDRDSRRRIVRAPQSKKTGGIISKIVSFFKKPED